MPATKTRETIYDKAQRILSDPSRVRTYCDSTPDFWSGEVDGDHGTYRALAISGEFALDNGIADVGRVACTCPAGRGQYRKDRSPVLCSHMIVAEEMRERSQS